MKTGIDNMMIRADMISSLQQRKNMDLFGSDIFEPLHWGKLFLHLFGKFFSTYSIRHRVDSEKLLEHLICSYQVPEEQIIRIEKSKRDKATETDTRNSEILLILKEGLCASVHPMGVYIQYAPDMERAEVMRVAEIAETYKISEPHQKKFFMVAKSENRWPSLLDFDIKEYDIDLESNYNDDFGDVHQTITSSMQNDTQNGIVLLHGMYGSGKTHYIRHLISTLDKKFIYLPLYMIDSLSSPEFIPFISEHKNAVLILEDCEDYLLPRESGNFHADGLSNLLNLGDGLLSDALSIHIICSFNAGLKKIDDALLRKGRLIARYEFRELETQKAQKLADKLQKNAQISIPMTLADIYNIEQTNFTNEETRRIGFAYA